MFLFFCFFLQRDARLKMQPSTEQDKFLIPEVILGNTPKVVQDENVNGEYGLVINGHSLVRNTCLPLCLSKSNFCACSIGTQSYLGSVNDKKKNSYNIPCK